MKSISRQFVLAPALLLCGAVAWVAPVMGQAPITRSIRQPGHHPVDELDRPRFIRRVSHRGWEFHTKHFVVTSTVSMEQAEWIGHQVEAVWSDMAPLADHWTDVHRQPTFGLGAVAVMAATEIDHTRGEPAPGPETTNYAAEIYLQVTDELPVAQLPNLRFQSAQSFFRVAQQDQTLPAWAQKGLSMYLARPGPAPPTIDDPRASLKNRLHEPDPAGGLFLRPLPNRRTADQLWPATDPLVDWIPPGNSLDDSQQSDLWVRYLLMADDARHAPAFLQALSATVSDDSFERFHWALVSQGVWRPRLDGGQTPRDRVEDLTGQAKPINELARWSTDPLAGQPQLNLADKADPELVLAGRRLAMIWKLAQRFQPPLQNAPLPRVTEFGPDGIQRVVALPGQEAATSLDLTAAYQRMTDPNAPSWATLDPEGKLLFGDQQEWIDALWHDPHAVFEAIKQPDGQQRILMRLGDGRTVESWIERAVSKDHSRPTIHIGWRRPAATSGVQSFRLERRSAAD